MLLNGISNKNLLSTKVELVLYNYRGKHMKRDFCKAVVFLFLAATLLPTLPYCQDSHSGSTKRLQLDMSDRDSWQMPERVMDALGVQPGMMVGDVGAGRGYLTLKLAKRVGETGHVYANDIKESVLETLMERCEEEGLTNVTTVLGEEADPKLPSGQLDLVILMIVYHELSDPVPLFQAIKPSLKADGRLVIIDFDKEKIDWHYAQDSKLVIETAKKAGYELVGREDFLPHQFLLIFEPTEN